MEQHDNIWRERSWKPFLFVLALGIALYFGFNHLTSNPPTWYDEGMILQLAENLAIHGQMSLQLAPADFVSAWHVSTGFPAVAPVALVFKLFGIGLLQGRVVAVIFLLLLAIMTFILLQKLFDSTYALWGMFLVVTFSSLYGNGKNVLGEVPGLFWLVAFLIAWYALERRKFATWNYAVLSGLLFGLACVTKPIFLMLGPALVIAIIVNRRKIVWHPRIVLTFAVAVCIPGMIWLYTQFGGGQGIREILSFYANPYHTSQTTVNIWTNFRRFFTEATPIYTLLTFAIWAVAIAIRFLKKRNIQTAELCAFIFSFIVLVAYLRLPGWYRYLFPANIPILMFLPYAIKVVIHSVYDSTSHFLAKIPLRRYVKVLPHIVLICLLVFQSYHLVFSSWISTADAGDTPVALAEYFSTKAKDKSVFIYDAPELVPFLANQNYSQFFSAGGVWVAGIKNLGDLVLGKPDLVLVDEAKLGDLKLLLAKYPRASEIGRYYILRKK